MIDLLQHGGSDFLEMVEGKPERKARRVPEPTPAPESTFAGRPHYHGDMQELLQQAAFAPAVAAAHRQIILSGTVPLLDTGLVEAIVLVVIEEVIKAAIRPLPAGSAAGGGQ